MLRKIIFLFLICLVNIDVVALCSQEEFDILKEKAKKVEISYDYKIVEYEEANDDYTYSAVYTLTAHNLDKDLLVVAKTSGYEDVEKVFKYNKDKTSSLSGYGGGRVNITIKGNTKNCDSAFRVQTINLLYYNFLYNDKVCKDYPLFKYCQSEFLDYDIYKKNFYVEYQEYLDELEKNKNIDNRSFFEKYFVLICILGLILIILIVLVISRIISVYILKRRKL